MSCRSLLINGDCSLYSTEGSPIECEFDSNSEYDSCCDYETDNPCDCGADLNIDERCTCLYQCVNCQDGCYEDELDRNDLCEECATLLEDEED